ncbi:MAG: ATP-grasp domain-containing protein [Streptosporangiaceae bacterium]
MRIHVLHENPEWFGPIGHALDAAGLPYEQWLLGDGALDLSQPPPSGVFWSRLSASSAARGHPHAKDQARGLLSWLHAHGRRVVNGRRALEFEVSKVDQAVALAAAGFDVPRTVAVAGTAALPDAARGLPVPFIAKHNQGGKGLGVRLFGSHEEFGDYVASAGYERPADGMTLLQEYLPAAEPRITRAEIVGGEFVYAITADTAAGGFQLCPADACAAGGSTTASLFGLRHDFDHPITGRYVRFAREHGIDIAGFEFIETASGRLVTYDINTTTNYNPQIEAAARRPALRAVAAYLGRLLDDEAGKAA